MVLRAIKIRKKILAFMKNRFLLVQKKQHKPNSVSLLFSLKKGFEKITWKNSISLCPVFNIDDYKHGRKGMVPKEDYHLMLNLG